MSRRESDEARKHPPQSIRKQAPERNHQELKHKRYSCSSGGVSVIINMSVLPFRHQLSHVQTFTCLLLTVLLIVLSSGTGGSETYVAPVVAAAAAATAYHTATNPGPSILSSSGVNTASESHTRLLVHKRRRKRRRRTATTNHDGDTIRNVISNSRSSRSIKKWEIPARDMKRRRLTGRKIEGKDTTQTSQQYHPTHSSSSRRSRSLIVGGTPSPPRGRYPYMVALVDEFNEVVCGGTLISLDVILTSSQCSGIVNAIVGGPNELAPFQQGQDGGAVGVAGVTSTDDGEIIPILDMVTHPFTTFDGRNYDYKLVKLQLLSTKGVPISTINIDDSLPKPNIPDGVTTMGYGTTVYNDINDYGPPSNVLTTVDIRALSNPQCNLIGPIPQPDPVDGLYDPFLLTYYDQIEDSMICAFDIRPDGTNEDFCLGDTGTCVCVVCVCVCVCFVSFPFFDDVCLCCYDPS